LKNRQFPRQTPSLPGQILTLALTAVFLVVALMFSVVVFVVLAVGGLLVWIYFWWKTRELRKQLRDRPLDASDRGQVIEGEVIRADDVGQDRLPR